MSIRFTLSHSVAPMSAAVILLSIACGGSSESGTDLGDGGTTTTGGTASTGGGSTTTGGGSTTTGGGSTTTGGGSTTGGTTGTTTTEKFSFFVTSYRALQELSGNTQGFGGDLKYGETGTGAGLRGADKICSTIAEKSMPGAGSKPWRAFLSATQGDDGKQVDAIDRIGNGPWYDRLGRVFANAKADVLADRPSSADAAIKNDFPNEDGVPNHQPDPTKAAVDNHDMLTGSNAQGKLYSSTAACLSWTSALGNLTTEGKPRVGHSWPRGTGGGGGGGSTGTEGGMNNWMSALTESGCKAGVNLVEQGGPQANAVTVGSGGGYGGFYCFALTP